MKRYVESEASCTWGAVLLATAVFAVSCGSRDYGGMPQETQPPTVTITAPANFATGLTGQSPASSSRSTAWPPAQRRPRRLTR
jgi:hypothetical protein